MRTTRTNQIVNKNAPTIPLRF